MVASACELDLHKDVKEAACRKIAGRFGLHLACAVRLVRGRLHAYMNRRTGAIRIQVEGTNLCMNLPRAIGWFGEAGWPLEHLVRDRDIGDAYRYAVHFLWVALSCNATDADDGRWVVQQRTAKDSCCEVPVGGGTPSKLSYKFWVNQNLKAPKRGRVVIHGSWRILGIRRHRGQRYKADGNKQKCMLQIHGSCPFSFHGDWGNLGPMGIWD